MTSKPSANNTDKQLQVSAKVIPVLLLVLLAGAIVYFKERMLFIDAPHVFFRIVNDGRLHIEEHRVGSFITQMVPLAGSWLHIPFKPLLVLYSASFYLFYLAVACLLVYRFRNYALAILFGLYLILFVSDTYYWPNNEVHQGIAWLMLAFALSFHAAAKKWPVYATAPLFILTFALAIWTHPLVMLVAVFLWFFYWIDNSAWPFSRSESVVFSIILLIIAGVKYYQGSHSGYDSSKLEMMSGFQPVRLRGLWHAPILRYFIKGCLTNYWLFPVLFMAGLAGMLRARKYLLLLWTLLFSAGYLTLICIEFWDVHSGRFYIESEYMPLAIIGCAPFVFFVLPKLKGRAGIAVLVAVGIIRLGYIHHAAVPFTSRVAIMQRMSNKMQEKSLTKVIISEPVPGIDSALIMNWGAPVESIFISKLKREQPQRTFIFVSPELLPLASAGKDTLLACWEKRTMKDINSRYFQLDTTAAYTVMSYADLMK